MPCFNWVKSITKSIVTTSYGNSLEQYVNSKHPKTLADIELYMIEFERKLAEKPFKT